MAEADRTVLLRRGVRLAIATISYNGLEGIIAIAAGLNAKSVALTGFGVDSIVEVTSAVIVGWRLHHELHASAVDDAARAEQIERRAARTAGALLLLLAAYLVMDAGRRLAGYGEQPDTSTVGLILTLASMLLMPLLAMAKLRTAGALGSRALRVDAYETIACVWLSITTFAGLAVNAMLGWWWADPLAALLLVPFIVREGWEAWKGEECCSEDR